MNNLPQVSQAGNSDLVALTLHNSAYKLMAVSELISTPERAAELSHDAFSGMRIVLEETAKSLLVVMDYGNSDNFPTSSCSMISAVSCVGMLL